MLFIAGVLGVAIAVSLTWDHSTDESGDYTVAAILDGDTIRLTDGQRVRLAQIDTPELSEPECYAQEAEASLAAMLPPGTKISLERDHALDNRDKYGRLIRYVVKDRANLNVVLVRSGAASVWFVDGERGRQAKRLLGAARHARRSLAGLWGRCIGTRLDPTHGVQTGKAIG